MTKSDDTDACMSRIVAFFLCVLLVLSGWMWYERASYPYNDEGRYLDEANMVVYHQQGEELWRLVFLATVALVMVYLFTLRILKEMKQRNAQ